ncbi:MAG: hypothetical protein U0164_18690 [Gemmatimonadaceae bacterium]
MTGPSAPPPPSTPPPPTPTRATSAGLVIAGVMTLLGLYVGGRVLFTESPPLTGTLALDLGFAVFFAARGALAYARFRRMRSGA